MRHYIIISALIFLTTVSFAQVIKRLNQESALQFAIRLKPDSVTIPDKALETKWNSDTAIIVFYHQSYKMPNQPGYNKNDNVYLRIIGTIFVKTDNNNYNKLLIDIFDTEGVDPKIDTTFFANADKDNTKELIIMASWTWKGGLYNGTCYRTTIYDNKIVSGQQKLELMKQVSKSISYGCDGAFPTGSCIMKLDSKQQTA